jgi:hypothetical protein
MTEQFDDQTLGQSEQVLLLDTSDAVRAASLAMVQQGARSVDIFTRDLDARLFDNAAFADAVSHLATSSMYAKIRILLHDDEHVVKHGHRLVDLVRRLSSYIGVRIISPDLKTHNHAFMVVDQCGYVFRELSDRYDAEVCFNGTGRARDLSELFDEVWEHSPPASNLRQLHI